jgi:hypothetical protein
MFALLMNVIVLPLALIWSINTLLGMHIEFTLLNWFASWAFSTCLRGAKFELKK